MRTARREVKCAAVVGYWSPTENPYKKLAEAAEKAKIQWKPASNPGVVPTSFDSMVELAKEWGPDHIMTCGAAGCSAVKEAVLSGALTYEQLGWPTPKGK